MASTSLQSKVKITILASEWVTSEGLPTINKELAIELAKFANVEVTVFLPRCTEDERKTTSNHNVQILVADPFPGFDEMLWLAFPPRELKVDIIVGYGVKLGRQAQIIRRTHNCKWVQVFEEDPEGLLMFQKYNDPIIKGESEKMNEVRLCEMADFVVGIGPKCSRAIHSYLRWQGRSFSIFELTPGLFHEFMDREVVQVRKERADCIVLLGPRWVEDFEWMKELDIVGRAVASLPETKLLFIGQTDGNQELIAQCLLRCGVPADCIAVRNFTHQEQLKELFTSMMVDLVLMPWRAEPFLSTGLCALSAGLPVLVNRDSGFGTALERLPFGGSFTIYSGRPDVYAATIKQALKKDRKMRLDEAKTLRTYYEKEYNWFEQSKCLLSKMINLVKDQFGQPLSPVSAQQFTIKERSQDLEDWTKGEHLGTGAHGEVYKFNNRITREVLAVKIVNIQSQHAERDGDAKGVKELRNEIEILAKLRHERIVAYRKSVEKEQHLYLFMDYMAGGSLHHKIKREKALSEELTRTYTQQILEGLCYLHSLGIVHRDIKPKNVLLDENDDVKLADFGLAKEFKKIGVFSNLTSDVGTYRYMAPEVIHAGPYGRRADSWSVGWTVVEMLTGHPPLSDLEEQQVIFRVGSSPLEPEWVEGASREANNFIQAALTWEAKERPTSHELLQHLFICGSKGTKEDEEMQQTLENFVFGIGEKD